VIFGELAVDMNARFPQAFILQPSAGNLDPGYSLAPAVPSLLPFNAKAQSSGEPQRGQGKYLLCPLCVSAILGDFALKTDRPARLSIVDGD
jgi:hypothetical protein